MLAKYVYYCYALYILPCAARKVNSKHVIFSKIWTPWKSPFWHSFAWFAFQADQMKSTNKSIFENTFSDDPPLSSEKTTNRSLFSKRCPALIASVLWVGFSTPFDTNGIGRKKSRCTLICWCNTCSEWWERSCVKGCRFSNLNFFVYHV